MLLKSSLSKPELSLASSAIHINPAIAATGLLPPSEFKTQIARSLISSLNSTSSAKMGSSLGLKMGSDQGKRKRKTAKRDEVSFEVIVWITNYNQS